MLIIPLDVSHQRYKSVLSADPLCQVKEVLLCHALVPSP